LAKGFRHIISGDPMTYSLTLTETTTFTITHARHMAAKVATDLKRLQRFYGRPSDADITAYEAEVIALIKKDYLGIVTYGFKKDGNWIEPTIQYTARDLAGFTANDDDPGRVRPGADITDASFHTYLIYSPAWDKLSALERDVFKLQLPFQRQSAAEPGVNGYFQHDLTYSSGGRALNRATVRSF
jgi:Bacterial HORMA domain family 1